MKTLKKLTAITLTIAWMSAPLLASGEDKKDEKSKPYPLQNCIVSDEKLGEMGKPFVFVHEGQEIKLCCKSCLKDFNKAPAKYLKKLDGAAKADSKPDKK